MTIIKKTQPFILPISSELRLRAFQGDYHWALPWYQDPFVYKHSEGLTQPVNMDYIIRMYDYLVEHGELYFIEAMVNGQFKPIGDICVKQENMPVVIGDGLFRGKGIAKQAMGVALERAKAIGINVVRNTQVFDDNIASLRLHESLGYVKVGRQGKSLLFDCPLTADAAQALEQFSAASVLLTAIDEHNVKAYMNIKVNEHQKDFLMDGTKALAMAYAYRDRIVAFGLTVDGLMVGSCLLRYNRVDAETETGNYIFLWNMMIDKQWQGRGFGSKAVIAIINWAKAVNSQDCSPNEAITGFGQGAKSLVTTVCEGNDDAMSLYLRHGFEVIAHYPGEESDLKLNLV